jgi:hypothetical protein
MARRSYRSRAYGGARRAYSFRRTYKKGGFGVGITTPYLIGLGASFIPVALPPVANTAIAAVAVAPVKLPGGVQGIARGFMLGKIIQSFIGNPLAGALGANNTGTTTNSGWY